MSDTGRNPCEKVTKQGTEQGRAVDTEQSFAYRLSGRGGYNKFSDECRKIKSIRDRV